MRQRKTRQMEVILEILENAQRPLTRKEIHETAMESLPGIGFATVSRMVNQLLENFQLVSLQYPGQTTRYEKPSDQEHPHLLCSHCDKIYDVPLDMPNLPLPSVDHFEITGYEVLYFGKCSSCKNIGADSSKTRSDSNRS